MPLARVFSVTLPRPGVEPGSPGPQRGILTTILPWLEIAVETKFDKILMASTEPLKVIEK